MRVLVPHLPLAPWEAHLPLAASATYLPLATWAAWLYCLPSPSHTFHHQTFALQTQKLSKFIIMLIENIRKRWVLTQAEGLGCSQEQNEADNELHDECSMLTTNQCLENVSIEVLGNVLMTLP